MGDSAMTKSRNLRQKKGAGNIVKKGNVLYKRTAGQYDHRTIMERHLGRTLATDEHVHHIDGNGLNNCIDNLEVISSHSHAVTHHRKPLTWDIEKALEKRANGATLQEIAQSIGGGIHWTAVWSAFKLRGISTGQIRKSCGSKPSYDIDEAIRLYESGISIEAVAEIVGASAPNLNKSMRRRGTVIRGPKQVTWDTDKALALRAGGMPYSEIAAAVGTTVHAVKGFIAKQKRLNKTDN